LRTDYDILIVGGGMVGASLARALSGTGLRVGVVEAVARDATGQPSYDDRVIALAWVSRLVLGAIGRWDDIEPAAEPIREIHVSDRGHFGFTRLRCADHGLPALGYVAPARAIGQGLLGDAAPGAALDWIRPAAVEDFAVEPDRVVVALNRNGESRLVTARLLVAADGGESSIRTRLEVPVQGWSYGHSAVIATVTPGQPHRGVAYERFTDSGPLAMLPMTEGRCSLVWTQRDERVQDVLDLDDDAFLEALQGRFGFRLGRLQRVGRRAAYPLRLLRVKEMVHPRLVLIGNAAHTLHPIAGQGFNLGLRDVAELAEVLADAHRNGEDPGSPGILRRYAVLRHADQRQVALITDFLARVFVNPLLPVRLARNLGLLTLDLVPPLKRGLARRFLGLRGRLPRLARGLPIA
jgi:2-octaprenyl-6-methoxyphenol hydroxylase